MDNVLELQKLQATDVSGFEQDALSCTSCESNSCNGSNGK